MAKKKKQSSSGLMEDIKKMESEKRDKAMKKVEKKEEKVSFDAWWMTRSARIPRNHMKEIIKADFRGRKLSNEEKTEDYDKALAAYGIKL